MEKLEELDFIMFSKDIIGDFEKLTTYLGNAFGSAFCCVLAAPFSRKISKECHTDYVTNKKLFADSLKVYFGLT
ncbi:MAG: hypothetical protein PHH54_07285 [Candidatus Nanoarchaeia archaeon]|nr:hypothetical protein [Candidatus Nanoarchaeia archaeon]MDD5741759.1 hypothetical protein [Candidatus Nanoarchaeia archaeon]